MLFKCFIQMTPVPELNNDSKKIKKEKKKKWRVDNETFEREFKASIGDCSSFVV